MRSRPNQNVTQSSYDRWLNQDVVYIISDAERAAFLSLETDEERRMFIEQFWLRRDPTPGTPENEVKIEHYRRIVYSDEHFTGAKPGWQTDRGKVYILYGPPDELESHQADHRENWLYRHIAGVGENVIVEFVDASGNGDYRWTKAPKTSAEGNISVDSRRVGNINPSGRVQLAAQMAEQNLLVRVDPLYPTQALAARLQGTVRFVVVIGKDGRVTDTQLVSGHPLLVNAAKDAIMQWVYKPTIMSATAVEVMTQVDVNFRLDK
jgi:TonB family protein